MIMQKKSPLEILIEKLDKELMARGARVICEKEFEFTDPEGTPQRDKMMAGVQEYYQIAAPPSQDQAFSHISTRDLAKILMLKTQELNAERGTWGEESRRDYYEITNSRVRNNANSVAAICLKDGLIQNGKGNFSIRRKNYGKAFNLCQSEPFYHQDIAAGRLCTGFLVKKNLIATACHCLDKCNLKDLLFVFGYRITDSLGAINNILPQNIYKGVEIIKKVYKRLDNGGSGSDWALVKLDREVEGQEIITLSKKELICHKNVYIIGHPVGLPLKYSDGASISNISDAYFSADLNVYCGSSGSPVFDSETHEVIGIAVRGDNEDFRVVENCLKSIIYSRSDRNLKKPECTRVSEFISYCT